MKSIKTKVERTVTEEVESKVYEHGDIISVIDILKPSERPEDIKNHYIIVNVYHTNKDVIEHVGSEEHRCCLLVNRQTCEPWPNWIIAKDPEAITQYEINETIEQRNYDNQWEFVTNLKDLVNIDELEYDRDY